MILHVAKRTFKYFSAEIYLSKEKKLCIDKEKLALLFYVAVVQVYISIGTAVGKMLPSCTPVSGCALLCKVRQAVRS